MDNLICRATEFGKETKVQFYFRANENEQYSSFTFFFRGKKPRDEEVVLIRNIKHFPKQVEGKIYYLSEKDWAKPKLEDFVDENTENNAYNFSRKDYSSREYAAFIKKFTPITVEMISRYLNTFEVQKENGFSNMRLNERIRKILLRLATKPEETLKTLANQSVIKSETDAVEKKKTLSYLTKYSIVLSGICSVSGYGLDEEIERFYQKTDEKLTEKTKISNPLEIIEILKKCRSREVKYLLEEEFLRKITDTNNRVSKEEQPVLEEFAKIAPIAVDNSNIRWTLPGNVHGKTIEISHAKELRQVNYSKLVKAMRIGNISNSEHVLLIKPTKQSEKEIYIKGGKKLKRQARDNGGAITKYGCALSVQEGLPKELLEMEKINALSILRPEIVIKTLKAKKFDTTELEKLVPRIENDFLEARKLADSAIELLYKIDPKQARKLIKQFSI